MWVELFALPQIPLKVFSTFRMIHSVPLDTFPCRYDQANSESFHTKTVSKAKIQILRDSPWMSNPGFWKQDNLISKAQVAFQQGWLASKHGCCFPSGCFAATLLIWVDLCVPALGCLVITTGSQFFGYKMEAVTAPSCSARMSRGKSQKTEKHVGVSCEGY